MDITLHSGDGTALVARRTGQGEPIVLVHGSAGGLGSWDPIVPLIAGDHTAWVYARRGYPPSGNPGRPKTFADDVADLRTVLAAAGGRAHVAGASYGATVALHAAAEDGAGIRTLTVFEPPLFAAGAAVAGPLTRYREALTAGAPTDAARIFAADVARVPAPIAAGAGPAEPGEAEGMLHDLEAMAADSQDITRWARIGVPVRIVQGSDTWAPMPQTMDALAAALPSAARVVLPGQSHFATHTAPAMFADALRR